MEPFIFHLCIMVYYIVIIIWPIKGYFMNIVVQIISVIFSSMLRKPVKNTEIAWNTRIVLRIQM